jgi:hypothetical protein
MEEEKKAVRNDEVYAKVVRAGKRTYFFDVKSTRNNDLYVTLTESKKTTYNGQPSYEKHKLFLYKEDFEKFTDGLQDVLNKIEELKQTDEYSIENGSTSYTSVDFDELS